MTDDHLDDHLAFGEFVMMLQVIGCPPKVNSVSKMGKDGESSGCQSSGVGKCM